MFNFIKGVAANITVFKSKHDQITEKYHTTCDDCGGKLVNTQFFEVLDEIVGESVMERLRETDAWSFIDFELVFECLKRTAGNANKMLTMTVPMSSLDTVCHEFHNRNFQSLVEMSKYGGKLKLIRDKMRIDADTFRNFFKSTIDNVITLMEKIFIEYNDSERVTHIFMVGGFSECSLVHDAVRQKFSSKDIIFMESASMVATRGAVLCRHQPRQYLKSPSHEVNTCLSR